MSVYEVILYSLDEVYDNHFIDDNISDPDQESILCREVLYQRKIFKTLREAYEYLFSVNIIGIFKEYREKIKIRESRDEDGDGDHIYFFDYENPLITTILLDKITPDAVRKNILNFHPHYNHVERDDFFLRHEVAYKELYDYIYNMVEPFIFPKRVSKDIAKYIDNFSFSKRKLRSNNKRR